MESHSGGSEVAADQGTAAACAQTARAILRYSSSARRWLGYPHGGRPVLGTQFRRRVPLVATQIGGPPMRRASNSNDSALGSPVCRKDLVSARYRDRTRLTMPTWQRPASSTIQQPACA